MSLPTPYYQDEWATIYHADCREVLPLLPKVDLVLTDPPYGISLNTDTRRFSGGNNAARRGKGRQDGPIIGDHSSFDPSFLLAVGRRHIIWGWNHFADRLPSGACLVWLKRYDDAFGTFLSDAEIAWMSKGCGVYCRRDLSNNSITGERAHPTQKPVGLMKWCLSFFPNVEITMDPFMGSGTTLRAAKDLGLRSIGIEIEERYCAIAVERLRQESLLAGLEVA